MFFEDAQAIAIARHAMARASPAFGAAEASAPGPAPCRLEQTIEQVAFALPRAKP
jgi:hypothetical protein